MPGTGVGAQSTRDSGPARAGESKHQLSGAACGASVPLSRAVAWLAAGLGMSLFSLAGAALVGTSVTLEHFWALSALGFAMYVCAHLLGRARDR